jgi:gamma-glutamylcyclotransferase (GGCT)/AIG2-like uncharacterized protein YtfP
MLYFAYGSNLNPGQMTQRCPGHRTLAVARLTGHRLVFPRFSPSRRCASASVEPSPGDAVWGVVYQLAPDDIPVLHYHEGYDSERPMDENRHDLREVSVVRMDGSERIRAVTYVAVGDGTTELPSAEYLDTILDGARYHGLPRAYISFLQSIKTA